MLKPNIKINSQQLKINNSQYYLNQADTINSFVTLYICYVIKN